MTSTVDALLPDAADLERAILRHVLSSLGRDPERADRRDIYRALSFALRDLLIQRWIATQKELYADGGKRVYYLSLEFLVGRFLGNTLASLGLTARARDTLATLGFDLQEIVEQEEEAALGNGGLGRLAACFMDSMATLGLAGYGYGIRYEYGLFYQKLVDGFQVEQPDNWLRFGTPWEIDRQQVFLPVRFYGRVEHYTDEHGRFRTRWLDTEEVMAMPCDLLVPGYDNDTVLNIRLWTAKASREIDLADFNRGDYIAAMEEKVRSETISKVLYPSDDIREGQELRLKQQYFFVAATFQDILRRYRKRGRPFDELPDAVAVQLNDTHPAIAIPELMRLLVDEEGLGWEKAWDITVRTFGYTNHTLMPEALETWPVDMLGRVLPRHLEIIYEINRRFLTQVAIQYPGDTDRLRRMSLIEEGQVKKVRMAHLAIVGSHRVNGVAALHSRLLRERIFPDFDEFFPGRFINITNGVTPRRWLAGCNPALAGLISEAIGDGWRTDLERLRDLEPLAADAGFRERWRAARLANKERLADLIRCRNDLRVDPASLFDVQVKRIHEYKRQLLNVLHVITLYHRLLADPDGDGPPRTVIFAGKAAPSYRQAKLIIRLITGVAGVINHDVRVRDRLRVVFLTNYSVTLAERIVPAADLSEQISTVGTEASGTGNMKMALNGALIIGTLDGANIEIREAVGAENFFHFGTELDEVAAVRQDPERTPRAICERNAEIRRVIEAIDRGLFSGGDRRLFQPLLAALLRPDDPYLVLADLEDYLRAQQEVAALWRDPEAWSRRSILTVARMGWFSSDRAVAEYACHVWRMPGFAHATG